MRDQHSLPFLSHHCIITSDHIYVHLELMQQQHYLVFHHSTKYIHHTLLTTFIETSVTWPVLKSGYWVLIRVSSIFLTGERGGCHHSTQIFFFSVRRAFTVRALMIFLWNMRKVQKKRRWTDHQRIALFSASELLIFPLHLCTLYCFMTKPAAQCTWSSHSVTRIQLSHGHSPYSSVHETTEMNGFDIWEHWYAAYLPDQLPLLK